MNKPPVMQYFAEKGYITSSQYYEILYDLREHSQKKFPDILIEYKLYNEKEIAEKMAEYWDVDYFDLSDWNADDAIERKLMEKIPVATARKYCACIVEQLGRRLVVVTDEPHNFEMIDVFRGFAGHDVITKMGVRSEIFKAIDKVYGVSEPEPADDDDDNDEKDITIERAARYFNVGLCRVNDVNPPKKLLKKLTYETAVKYCCFPISVHDDTVYFAIDNPANIEAYEELKKLVGGRVVFRIADRKEILKKIDQLYGGE